MITVPLRPAPAPPILVPAVSDPFPIDGATHVPLPRCPPCRSRLTRRDGPELLRHFRPLRRQRGRPHHRNAGAVGHQAGPHPDPAGQRDHRPPDRRARRQSEGRLGQRRRRYVCGHHRWRRHLAPGRRAGRGSAPVPRRPGRECHGGLPALDRQRLGLAHLSHDGRRRELGPPVPERGPGRLLRLLRLLDSEPRLRVQRRRGRPLPRDPHHRWRDLAGYR